jgi:hypothetical protein
MQSRKSLLNELVDYIDGHVSSSLNRADLDRLARITGFNRRCGKAKITGSMFLDLVVFNANKLSALTLESCCEDLMNHHHQLLTRQSLHERFNSRAVIFLKSVLEVLLKRKFEAPTTLKGFDTYKRILIKDSTCFQLPEEMRERYPGSGGKDTGAAARIQFEYDILSGNIVDLNITPFNRQDATDSIETSNLMRQGDLVIRDIAYMHKNVLIGITTKGASYISRLDNRINTYELKDQCYMRLDFSNIYKDMRSKQMAVMEKTIYLGVDHSHKCRLVIYMVPDEIQKQRLRKIRKERKRNGSGEPTKELKDRSRFILIITNDLEIPAEHMYSLYMVRWQIELIFKTWKSICGISSLKKVNAHRVECYIYGKLILILLGWNIIRPLVNYAYLSFGKMISYYKSMKVLISRVRELSLTLLSGKYTTKNFVDDVFKNMKKNCLMDLKKGDITYFDLIASKIRSNS